jgi:hypothetical protein
VPALVIDVGRRVWWPSKLAKREDPTTGSRAASVVHH